MGDARDDRDPYDLASMPPPPSGANVTWTEENGVRRRTTTENMTAALNPDRTTAREIRTTAGGVMFLIEERGGTNMDPKALEDPYALGDGKHE